MELGALPGLLAATLAALSEVLVVGGTDRRLGPIERGLQVITAAYVGGQAVLGVVLAILSVVYGDGRLPSPASWLGGVAIVLAAVADGLIWRSRPRSAASDMTPADRAATLLRLALAQAIGVLGFVAAVIQYFIQVR